MRKVLWGMLLSATMAAASQAACAGGFEGLYVAAKAGADESSAFGQTRTSAFAGAEAGYNLLLSREMVVGIDVWGDNHRQSATGRDVGADAKLGNVVEATMYYAKVGMAATHPGARVHYGLGVEYKFDSNWGGLVEWTGDTLTKDATTYTNNNLVLGATLRF